MRIIGLDLSITNTGLCVLTDTDVICRSISTKRNLSLWERAMCIVTEIRPYFKISATIVFEDFGISSMYGPSKYLPERLELTGMIKLLAYYAMEKKPFLLVKPSLLKMMVTDVAGADKKMVLSCVNNRYGILATNFDEADAFGLALCGYAVINAGIAEGTFWVCPKTGYMHQFSKKQLQAQKKLVEINTK